MKPSILPRPAPPLSLRLAGLVTATAPFILAAASALAGTFSAPTNAPTVQGCDIANLVPSTGSDKWFNDGSTKIATAAKGQTFTTGNSPALFKSITYKCDGTTMKAASPTTPTVYTVRVGTVSGTTFTQIASETCSQTFSNAPGSYMTWTLDTPVLLAPNTTYAVDVAMTTAGMVWNYGIPYLSISGNAYAAGQLYNSGVTGVGAATVAFTSTQDRLFHLRLQDPMVPSPESGTTNNPGGNKVLSWSNLPPNTGTDLWVDVWFGTNQASLTKVLAAGQNTTNLTVNAPVAATYYWRVDSYLDGAPTGTPVAGTLWNFVITDSDADGIPDWWMLQYFGHPTGQASDLSRAGDDADGDGLTTLQEYQLGTNPTNSDTDGDGLKDGDEFNLYHTNPALADTDGDGLSDGAEVNTYHTNPLLADTDGDGLSDGAEVNTYHTNPLLADTDGDGVGDWYEVVASFTSPTNALDKPNVPYPLPRPSGSTGATNKPVKVFILSGQSNMVGEGNVDPVGTPGTLSTIVKQQHKFPDLVQSNGNWSAWSNVFYRGVITALGNGPLTAGQGASSGKIGPELGFGHVMGWYFNEPVLVLKSSQGNRALGWDFRPPGSPGFDYNGYTYPAYGETPEKWVTGTTPAPVTWYAGFQYDQCFLDEADWSPEAAVLGLNTPVQNVVDILDNFATQYPQWAGQGFEIAGYVWWQGNRDIGTGAPYTDHYETNMVQFIKQLRAYYANRYPGKCSTNTPFVLATGCGDPQTSGNGLVVANAQLAVSGERGKYPEFAGNVRTMDTRGYWRDASISPGNAGYHYNLNAETYMLTGDALGRGMISLLSAGTATDYSSWATKYAGANLTDPNADYDADGLSNDYERIWGLDPTSAASRNAFASISGLKSGTFSYTRRTQALTGLNYTVWTSTDLATWTQDTGALQSAAAPVSDVETVTVTLSPSLLNGQRLFMRMRAQ